MYTPDPEENNIDHETVKMICEFITTAVKNASDEIEKLDIESDSEVIKTLGKHITKRLSYMKDEGFISDFTNEFDKNHYD